MTIFLVAKKRNECSWLDVSVHACMPTTAAYPHAPVVRHMFSRARQ